MKRRRRFIDGECNHIYQRTVKGFNIFYDLEDYLVFYMILSTSARKFNVRILKICLMVDHIHILLEAESCKEMAEFVRYYSSVFVREFNDSIGREGQLMYKSFGSAPKKGDKKTRSAIVYIGNNPVEKKICASAEEYRWNFIAYMDNKNPFSQDMPLRNRRKILKLAMKEAATDVSANRYMSYSRLRWYMSRLNQAEKDFFADTIISLYMPIDKEALLDYYSDVPRMVAAMKASAGNDYDIREKVTPHSDLVYNRMIEVVRAETGLDIVRKVVVLPEERKMELAAKLQKAVPSAQLYQICKFLHLVSEKR